MINPEIASAYPYVGISAETDKIINISAQRLEIIKREESVFFEEDYLSTSRFIEADLEYIDKLIAAYIGPFEYRILVNFNEHKHMVLTYHSPTNEAPKDYDIFDGYPEARARLLVDTLYPIFEQIRSQADAMDA
ncbi:MAG: hypothetical protein JO301_02930 [Chitinophagaceae bacterium]|nr:hypothetical protein [Chitinophagaceae bacterium]